MAENADAGTMEPGGLEPALAALAERVSKAKASQPGLVLFHASGPDSGTYQLDIGHGETKVLRLAHAAQETRPRVEIIGDGAILKAIIDGKKDAFRTFLGGGVRVRGDLQYFSSVAYELGFLKNPL